MNEQSIELHIETLTQMLVGLILGYVILRAFGLTNSQSITLQFIFFVVSYARSYTNNGKGWLKNFRNTVEIL